MPNRHDEFLNTRTFHDLDGLRAISVIAVVWHHTAALAFPDVHVLQQGLYGVDFFFAISGFLITTLLLREHRRTGRISYRRFLGRRALRIFPLFYVVLATYVLLTIATRRGTPEATEFFHNLPAFATYTSNWFVDLEHGTSVTFYFAWSLATEEQFYLLWPPLLILLLARWRRSVVAPIVAVIAIIVVELVALHVVEGDHLVLTILRSPSLPMLLGVLGALLADRAPTFRVLDGALGHAPVTVALAGALAVLLAVESVSAEAIQVCMALLVISCCLPTKHPFGPVLEWGPLVRVGVVSYGVYLMHMLAANVVRPVVGHDFGIVVFLGASAIAYIAAEISYRWFELPLLRVKDRLFASPGKAAPTLVTPPIPRPADG